MEYMLKDPAFRAFVLMAMRRPLAITWQDQEAQVTAPSTSRGQTPPPPVASTYEPTEAPSSTEDDPEAWCRPDIPVGRGSNRGRRDRSKYNWLLCQCRDARPSQGASHDMWRDEPAPTSIWSTPNGAVHDVMAEPEAQSPAEPLKKEVATNTDPPGEDVEEPMPVIAEPTPDIYPEWKEHLVLAIKELIPRRGEGGKKFRICHIGKVVQPPGGGEPYLVAAKVDINANPNAMVKSWARVLEALVRKQTVTFSRDRNGSAVPFSSSGWKANAGQRMIVSLSPLGKAAGIP